MYIHINISMCMHMYIQKEGQREDLLRELVHLVMEADKSHDRPSAGLRTREPGSVAHSLSMGCDPWKADGVTLSLRPKAQSLGACLCESGVLAFQRRRRGWKGCPLSFCSIQATS